MHCIAYGFFFANFFHRFPGEGNQEGWHPYAGHGRQSRRSGSQGNDWPGGENSIFSLLKDW